MISDILNRDPMTFEDAYYGERPSVSIAVPALLQQLKLNHDAYTRGKIIELLGECEDQSVLPILENELRHPDANVRGWAERAIVALKSGEKWQE